MIQGAAVAWEIEKRLSDTEQEIADQALVAALAAQAAWQEQPVAIRNNDIGLFIAGATDYPVPVRNVAVRRIPDVNAHLFLDYADGFFGSKKRSFTVLCRDDESDLRAALVERKAHLLGAGPRMVCRQPVSVPSPPELRLQSITSAAEVKDLVAVVADAFGYPDGEAQACFASVDTFPETVHGCLGYMKGAPMASAISLRSETSATLDWVATKPAARRKGYAYACVSLLAEDIFRRGIPLLFLTSTAGAANLYRRAGFRVFGCLQVFLIASR
ncbi:hypothetical protein CAI21_18845 [Alkalilimnicola ehrlichii]|uniref:N-acetyltransferase domain-containing protein n=1 Tax=Alkalilimnicola ehrlichii TaxID=351052 RepID=A0A3E0WKP0_9GAMM|nr:GNAT family N-acetyltransferase [Alkalilimnicola ehrlichii]RFA25583.1 hypothetical protein CAI21_18845 [Alkalilimnicola ehrlichii]RFA32711.1 hypothetical protein CAL65_19110 [Alkalilimnicola ehrlichii]